MREYVSEPRIDVFDPRHNARQIAKELTLLEDHLRHPPQHCPDCVRKHILKAEAYADEAISLDTDGTLSGHFDRAGAGLRNLARKYGSANTHSVQARRAMAQEARQIRKHMGKMGFANQSQKPARRVMMRPSHIPAARRVSLGLGEAMGSGVLDAVGTPGWASYPTVDPGSPMDFSLNYRPNRPVVFQGGTSPSNPIVTVPDAEIEFSWKIGRMIGPGQGASYGCESLNAANDYVIPDMVAPDPSGKPYSVTFINRVTNAYGEADPTSGCGPNPNTPDEVLASCNCTLSLPRAVVPVPFGPQWVDVFPSQLQLGVWTFYSEGGVPIQTNEGLMSPGFGGGEWGGPRFVMTRLIQGVLANKIAPYLFTRRNGWSDRRQGALAANVKISRLYSIAFITIGACTSTLMPEYRGAPVSMSGQTLAYPGRSGLIPMPNGMYPLERYAQYPEYDPQDDAVVSILLALHEATRDETDPTSPYSVYMAPLVTKLLGRDEAEVYEWVYAVARTLGFSENEAKRFEYSAKDAWGIAPPNLPEPDPRNGGGVSELLGTGSSTNQTERLLRDIQAIYTTDRRKAERGDVIQANAVWAAKTRIEQNHLLLPEMVQRDAERSEYPMTPMPGSRREKPKCTPTECTISLTHLYRGWPSNAPHNSIRAGGARTPPYLALSQSPDAKIIIDHNYHDMMTIGRYRQDHEAYVRAWYWALLLNEPCKEAPALRSIIRLVPGTRQAQAAQVRLSELQPDLVTMCPDTSVPTGMVAIIGGVAGLGLWLAHKQKERKEQ